MTNSIRAEFLKLITVRSTYFITGFACLVAAFFSFVVMGINFTPDPFNVGNAYIIRDGVFLILNNTLFLLGLVALLLFTHEYRYNIINYTLTSTSARWRVLMAKSLVITAFSVFFVMLVTGISFILMKWGVSLSGVDIGPQTLDLGQTAWRALFGGFGVAMFALLIGGLIRNQVGAIVTFLVGPGAIEALLALVLKANATYLPFTALNQVLFAPGGVNFDGSTLLSPGKSAIVVCLYIVVFWALSLFLFNKRDAN